ncbi:RNA polymerase sigma factor [Kordiimonas sp.]|uniref:RNA polymerase sigma factor n=1 Tax=Kordiimonas sp. TaxID=1970157 RepID=UPI003A8F46D2
MPDASNSPLSRPDRLRASSRLTPGKETGHQRITGFYKDNFQTFVTELRASFSSSPSEAEDVAQRAFEKLIHHSPRAGRIENIRAYLWRIARNIMISDYRKQKASLTRDHDFTEAVSSQEGDLLTPERVLEAKEQMQLAWSILEAMPDQRRRAFSLVRLEGLSHAEAAARLGISRPAVTKHVAKATSALYGALAGRLEGE